MTTVLGSVLFVDDEPAILDAIRRSLRHEPYALRCAGGSATALAEMAEDQADIVVSDLHMPGTDGLTLLMEIRRRYPETVRMVLSGHATLEDSLRAINEGEIHRFFVKPVAREDLLQGLRQGIAHQRLQVVARRLFERCKRQSSVISTLEQEQPGITRVDRDSDGAIILEGLPAELDDLL